MVTNEKLIEEAAKAIADYQGVRYEGSLKDTWDAMARAALAVFKEANTPTEDEREALATVLDDVHGDYVTEGGCDFRGWLRGWRPGARPEVNGVVVDPILAALRAAGKVE